MICEHFVPKKENIHEKLDHFSHLAQKHQEGSNISEC